MSKYNVIIGLEIHVQALTESKVFCTCKNEFGAPSNSNVCAICLAHPGVLPVVNREAINQIIKAGLLTDSDIALYSKFDRKSYFYPRTIRSLSLIFPSRLMVKFQSVVRVSQAR